MLNQLTLGVGLKDEATFTNFYPGKNIFLVTALKNAARKLSSERVIYFYSAGGQGSTHLLQACCHEAHQYDRSAVYIPLTMIADFSPAIFEGLETWSLVCIDDIHRIYGKPIWEEAFFHLFNRLQDSGAQLIVTANVAPQYLSLLPDVVSRLAWGIVYQLQPLTDAEKLQVLIMRAERRGMTLSEEVGRFIMVHCPRHMSTLFAALDALDKMSLAAQRKLTIPFVKTILQI